LYARTQITTELSARGMTGLFPRVVEKVGDRTQFLSCFLELGNLFAEHFQLSLLTAQGVANLLHGNPPVLLAL
jgi:hypothetical protein